MARGPFAGELRESGVFLWRERQVVVVLFENHGGALFFGGRVEGARRNVVYIDGFFVELPRDEIDVAKAIEPRLFPAHEAVRDQLARKIGIFGSERLKFVECDGVANRPGHEWNGAEHGHNRHSFQPTHALMLPNENCPEH